MKEEDFLLLDDVTHKTVHIFSLNIFHSFSEEHIQTRNRKFGRMNNIMKKKRMGKQVQNTLLKVPTRMKNKKGSKIIRVDMLNLYLIKQNILYIEHGVKAWIS